MLHELRPHKLFALTDCRELLHQPLWRTLHLLEPIERRARGGADADRRADGKIAGKVLVHAHVFAPSESSELDEQPLLRVEAIGAARLGRSLVILKRCISP